MKVGILFGGRSREREVSFAGGRTIYDNLDKTLFEPVPIFIDSLGNLILLDWKHIYKGTIRDFYPPTEFYPEEEKYSQLYIESLLPLSDSSIEKICNTVGQKIEYSELKEHIDFAFLALHGSFGEDGTIQGILEWLGIPYSGSGILPSSIGIDKIAQKYLLQNTGSFQTSFKVLSRKDWLDPAKKEEILIQLQRDFFKKVVIKAPRHGSSIGVNIVSLDQKENLNAAIDQSFFIHRLSKDHWQSLSEEGRIELANQIGDIKTGLGFPIEIKDKTVYSPQKLISEISQFVGADPGVNEILLEAEDGEAFVLVEQFVKGREFSCIVLRNLDGNVFALPPTEIQKGQEVFDYRSKYLPGKSRKITPMDLPESDLEEIRKECVGLFETLQADVYARIDGFFLEDGSIYLNDPNTTSGMMPSSFFFHQAAEIGLNPKDLLSYIIRISLNEREKKGDGFKNLKGLKAELDEKLKSRSEFSSTKKKVAVVLGGYSSERHISVESGRNIFEKLSSSIDFEPTPIFLTGNSESFKLFEIPINLLLKDNADDIADQIASFKSHSIIEKIRKEASQITDTFSSKGIEIPKEYSLEDIKANFDMVFIGLHGRPGEDGQLQSHLEELGIPFNGSGSKSSGTTINKYVSNEILRKEGIRIPEHYLVEQEKWESDPEEELKNILSKMNFPVICKPADDGCSSAVKRIKNEEEFSAFADMTFRKEVQWPSGPSQLLDLDPKEEFPRKGFFLVEELIEGKGFERFLEITGGLLTSYSSNQDLKFEVFEPSEALTTGDVLSLEEKFLAGEGQNITPARFWNDKAGNEKISEAVKSVLEKTARVLNVQGYARIDAFVRTMSPDDVEVIIIEVNSLPGMTPATCIFHQSALKGYKPIDFISRILEFGEEREKKGTLVNE